MKYRALMLVPFVAYTARPPSLDALVSLDAFVQTASAETFTESILYDAQPVSTSRGFDGVYFGTDDSGERIVCSGAEQATSDNIVVAAVDGSYVQVWGTNGGSEDVICGWDFNNDNVKDVASASESGRRIRIWFGPYVDANQNGVNDTSPITLTVLNGAVNMPWIKLEASDVDCDGVSELVSGAKVATGGTWGWWEWTGGSSFAYHSQGGMGWAMQIQAIDWDGDSSCKDDLFITDRNGADSVDTEKGAWLWTNDGAGAFTGTQLRKLSGEEQFGAARDLDFDDDIDFIHGNRTSIEIATNNGDNTFTFESITKPSDTGDFHAPILCPDTTINGPFFMTFALSTGTESGVVMLRRNGGGWDRVEVSGISGSAGVTRKWDNGWCGFDGSNRLFATTEGGDSTQADDKGIVLFTGVP